MDRRAFLKSALAASAVGAPGMHALASAPWRRFEVRTQVEVQFPEGASRVWLPLPLAEETDWHRSLGSTWSGNASRAQVMVEPKYGARMLYAEWPAGVADPRMELTSRFAARDRSIDPTRPVPGAARLDPEQRAFLTAPTDYIPTDGIVRDTALGIVKGVRGDVEKARAIYEWVVDNTFRDPEVRGCGWGDIRGMLETGNLGGKCGDLNALFVGLARSVGVPARDVYGLRVAPSTQGYGSLGVSGPTVTRAQHCRAEFFAEGVGWVPVDPADVRKVALEEPPGNLPLSHPKVRTVRERLFGRWEMNWLAFNAAHDLVLPHSVGGSVPYFMYPAGETGDERLDPLEPEAFTYTITARELLA